MDYNQSRAVKKIHKGILPKFASVMQICGDVIPKSFSALMTKLFDNLDNEMLALAEKAESNDQRNRYFEALHELKLRRIDIEQIFYRNLLQGFENFSRGETDVSEAVTKTVQKVKLSLVEKEEYDLTLTINNVVNNACSTFLDRLYALNRRLAVVNGGTKLGEKNVALPGGPRHICNAFTVAVNELDFDTKRIIDLIRLFEKFVIDETGTIYDDFNSRLSNAGILPNLTHDDAVVDSGISDRRQPPDRRQPADQGSQFSQQPDPTAFQQPPPPQQPAYAYTGFTDEAIGEQLIKGISELLHRHHPHPTQTPGGFPGATGYGPSPQMSTSTLSNLMTELNALQHNTMAAFPAPVGVQYQPSITNIKAAFEEQIAKLADMVKKEQLPTPESDIIDLVGMLFEFILDDENMPDSVKALLSHLHTPYLKIAILDRKFFIRHNHPARKLLNAMSQAGSRCVPDDPNDVNVISKIQHIVNRVLNEFEENTELFSELLKEFAEFIANFNRRAMLMEKRSVASANGRDKLQAARRLVSKEIVDRSIRQKVPKVVERLLLGPWAGFLVITALRHGENSPEWKSAINVTDELIWSVQPKQNEIEREKLRNILPKIVDSVRAGIELAGDIDCDTTAVLGLLAKCHKAALATKKPTKQKSSTKKAEQTVVTTKQQQPNKRKSDERSSTAERQARWKEIIPKEWQEDLGGELEPEAPEMPECKELVDTLRSVELGTWFEFFDSTKDITQRGKLAWINENTSNYMFVNQGGRQIAVKSLYNLAKEIQDGDIKFAATEKTPFISRALNSIHNKLKGSVDSADTQSP